MIPDNPFFITAHIPDRYFCDRKAETDKLIHYVKNGYNVVLKAPRRIGKSSLIRHLFLQPEIKKNYNTLYVDIFGTKDLTDFISEFQRGFQEAPVAKGEKVLKTLKAFFESPYLTMEESLKGTPLPKLGNGNFYGMNTLADKDHRNDFYKRTRYQTRKFISYWWPIPQDDIDKNVNLVQLPEWN